MREIVLHNRHPRLILDRRTLARALAHLDASFRFTFADIRTLSPGGLLRQSQQKSASGSSTPSCVSAGELSVTFLTDAAMARLHADFLNDPTATDVITFDGDSAIEHAGDICVSVDTALAYSAKHDLPFAEELLRYVIHGWLHLAGYDDLQPEHKRRRRAAENRALKLLRDACLQPAFSLRPLTDSPVKTRRLS